MPALYNLRVAGLLDERFQIIGVDVRDIDDQGFRDGLTETMQHFVTDRRGDKGAALDSVAWDWMRERLNYLRGDFSNPETFTRLSEKIPTGTNAIFYFATAARFFEGLAEQLAGSEADSRGRELLSPDRRRKAIWPRSGQCPRAERRFVEGSR